MVECQLPKLNVAGSIPVTRSKSSVKSQILIADRVVDLSATGALVGPADPALTGERILVSFRIPRSTVWIDAEATVTRVVHGRRPGEFSRALAIEFDQLEALPRFMLQEALRIVPPAPPKSAPGRRSSQSLVRGLLQ